jgi:hypothetical protein
MEARGGAAQRLQEWGSHQGPSRGWIACRPAGAGSGMVRPRQAWRRAMCVTDGVMTAILWEPSAWATQNFGECVLGDQRRTKRLVHLAIQTAARPDGSTPEQTEDWADCKAAYRLFNEEDVTFEAILAPHCELTRRSCTPGSAKLIINDTTEIDYGGRRRVPGLGPTGNGSGRGFFLHSAMMLDATDGRIEGLAGQKLFHRKRQTKTKKSKSVTRRSADRESVVWSELVEAVGPPPPGVKWLHVCDRGADDCEIFVRIQQQRCGWVIRAARLNRSVVSADGRTLPLEDLLNESPLRGSKQVHVPATPKSEARTADVALRFCPLALPRPRVLTPWLRQFYANQKCQANSTGPIPPLPMFAIELREMHPPEGVQPLHWVLYTSEPTTRPDEAFTVIDHYERRPAIEDYHKGLKTGCHVEKRYYHTAARLERVTGLLSVVAIRLLQMRTAARETPNRPAREVAPARWVRLVQQLRNSKNNRPINPDMTIYNFLRAIAGLGGHLGRNGDGEPGWITLWKGFNKLLQIDRGTELERNKSG